MGSAIWGLKWKLQTSVNVHSTMKRAGRAIEFLAWALFFAAAAIVLAARFWLLPDIERHRGRIVAAVSAAVGQPVAIGGIEVRWFGLNPHVRLSDVRLHDSAGREVLTLPAVENRLAWSALLRGELKVHGLAIDDLRVQVRRDADGVLHVAGMTASGDPRFSRWLLAQDEIVLRNAEIEWHDELRGAPPLALSALNLRLRNARGRHEIGLTAAVPAALGSAIDLRAVVHGSLTEPAGWTGRLFAEIGYADLAAWSAWIDYPRRVESGDGALRAWLTVERGNVTAATADVSFTGVSARLAEELAPLSIARLAGRVQGSRRAGRLSHRGARVPRRHRRGAPSRTGRLRALLVLRPGAAWGFRGERDRARAACARGGRRAGAARAARARRRAQAARPPRGGALRMAR